MVYEIAGLRIFLTNEYPYTDEFCREYLSANQDAPVDFIATAAKNATDEEMQTGAQAENIRLFRDVCSKLPKFSRMFLHAAVLSYEGEGYAFLGKSGIGKSTHAALWVKHIVGAEILNGDKPIIEYRDGALLAHGTPWQGKERLGKRTQAPLRALCFIEQAQNNEIKRLPPSEASRRLLRQIFMPSEEEGAAATLELMDRLISDLPAYLLRCDVSEAAARLAFEGITGLSYEERRKK